MKKTLSFVLLFTLFVCGCKQDESLKDQSAHLDLPIVTAGFEQNESRTYIEEGNLLRWTKNDQISFFFEYTLNFQYQFDGDTGDNAGTFSPVKQVVGTGNDLKRNYAVYPYASGTKISESGIITATLPTKQSYAPNSFGLGANTMVAATEDIDDTFLKFKNVGGYLKLLLYGDNVTVKTITLQGNSNEKLAGTATITPSYNGDPTIAMADDATKVLTLDCGENGVEIGSTQETATAFWIVVPPTTFTSGFTITITDVNGNEFTKSTSKNIAISRNVIKPMTAFEVDFIPYITFKADAKQSLKMSREIKTLEYSVNGCDWETLGVKMIEFGGILGDLRLRGKSSIGTATTYDYYAQIKFTEDTKVSCIGNISTLVNYQDYKNANTASAKFCYLFADCSNLIEAPSLPIENLAKWCYYSMFKNCSNLIEAPILPAKTLSELCYAGMFEGCTNLRIAPELPAEMLAKQCYAKMFANCTNLIMSPPKLPARVLAQGCYQWMFKDCINLKGAPELLAEELAENSCYDMFKNCTSLTVAPELPAMKLAKQCYYGMFYNTGIIKTPKLPAENLASSCYKYMFCDCKNLKEFQEMSAKILSDECYGSMFKGCVSISTSPELPITTLADFCYHSMFRDCVNLITPPDLPATILANNCYSSMFNGCTSLTKSPELHASRLVQSCYTQMFEGCTNLNNITMTAIDISANSCLVSWVKDVSSTGTFIKASTMYSLPNGSGGIPNGWTVKNYNK